jgi:hypothetical protein
MNTLKRLRRLYRYHAKAAESCDDWAVHDEIMQHAEWIRDAVQLIEKQQAENQQLRERLVRQAMYFEQIEAQEQPKSWPLLEDNGEGL